MGLAPIRQGDVNSYLFPKKSRGKSSDKTDLDNEADYSLASCQRGNERIDAHIYGEEAAPVEGDDSPVRRCVANCCIIWGLSCSLMAVPYSS